MTNPTPLSPAAQAVLDAYWDDAPLEAGAKCGLAAALRAVADRIQIKEPLGDTDADAGVFAAHSAIHAGLIAIAAKLEGAQ